MRSPWREPERSHARWAWPAALALAGIGWYVSDSLRHRREGAFGYDLGSSLDVSSPDFLRAAEALTGAPISEGSEVELLINGDAIFPAILETIRGAERTLTLETYVYWQGEITREIADAVCERARAGVEVKILLDALGSAVMDTDQIDRMRDCGAAVHRFRPIRPYTIRRLANRSHRRVLVADGNVGLTGGVGIAQEWTGNAEDEDHWRDTHVRVRGPVVRHLQGSFAEHWLEATGEVLSGEGYLPHLEPTANGGQTQLVRSKSGVGDTNVETLYYLAIASARRSLDLTSAYFVPRPAFTEAIADAAERGVDVRILVPGPYIDKSFVRVAGRDSYAELLEAGVRIFEFQPTMLHAKTLVVDGVWSSVGTINFDNRSFQLHDEITLCVWDEHFADLLTAQFEADVERSDEITQERWAKRGVRERAAEASMRLLRREL
ncbi:MAG: phospholipase D-like domain-containing protein [Actinomycetota bacterium]|nr:phospholipase D-like domain-containing protein [Actinomycetota bacterium]